MTAGTEPGAPLTRREARAREAALLAAPAVPAPAQLPAPVPTEYVAVRTESVVDDFPRRSAAGAQPKRKPSKAARSKAGKAPRGRKVKVRFEKAPKRRSSLGSKLFSFAALLGAGALLVGMSVPANAFMEADDNVLTGAADKAPGQSLAVSDDAAVAAPDRSGFEVISYAEVLRLKYSGINYAYTATTGAVRWPFPYPVPITDGFGVPRDGWPHKGIDFVPGAGTPIYAIAAGTVLSSGFDNSGYGNHVVIQHNLGGVDVKSNYAHMIMDSSPVRPGDNIEVGDFLGLVGDTGIAYGAHLHFEILIDNVHVDPYAWLQANASN